MRRLLVRTLPFPLALAAISMSHGQGADIRITELNCNSSPERVVIQNTGDETQDMSGWAAQSDPPDAETLDLSGLAVLEPGESVALQSGQRFDLRDNDPTDYVRIVDQTGATVHEVHCDDGTAQAPAPSEAPGSDVASEASGAVDVPNGGGAPAIDGAGPATTLLILVGGALAAAGLATSSLAWRTGYRPMLRQELAPAALEPVMAHRPQVQAMTRGCRRSRAAVSASTLAALGAGTALAVIFWSWRQHQSYR